MAEKTDILYACPCLFGLESVLSDEIRKIGGQDLQVTDGRVMFRGPVSMAAKGNLWLRTAERLLMVLGSFTAESFTALFDGVYEIPWEDYLGRDDAFPVKGWSLNSQLHSIPDCQKIIKKAVVKRLQSRYQSQWFAENGPVHQIQFSILKNQVVIALDTSGAGLHKRGYRPNANEAPIKETLAAGILSLARVRSDTVLFDPMCGSGTFLIEGALMAMNIAPGIRRRFACEKWGLINQGVFEDARREAAAGVNRDAAFTARGMDIDPEAVKLTKENAVRAGVPRRITVSEGNVADFQTDLLRATVVCNPPYGERMLELNQCRDIYQAMGKAFEQRKFLSYYVISPDEEFEKWFGRKADRRRKLYNGMIRCQLYMFFKAKGENEK